MESRKITVVSTTANTKLVIETEATTLGDLKRDLDRAGLDYTDMIFYEGMSRTELIDDASQLPHDVQRTNRETGEVETTNELLFLLSLNGKKYSSGACDYSTRIKMYEEIKKHGLSQKCKDLYGKNYTNCSTLDLKETLDKYHMSMKTGTKKGRKTTEKKEVPSYLKEDVLKNNGVLALLAILGARGVISQQEIMTVIAAIKHPNEFNSAVSTKCKTIQDECKRKEDHSPYSDEEIRTISDSLGL